MATKRPFIDFRSDRMRILAPFLSESVIQAALARVIMGQSIPEEFSKGERKSTLLMVLEINPHECLEEQEEQSVRGVSKPTLKKMKDEKSIPRVFQAA